MTAASGPSTPDRPIRPDERSGVLHPENLTRYDARWVAPDAAVEAVVDQYWYVSWSLSSGERLDQRIIDLPAITVTVEDGDVPAPLVVTGVQRGAWRRTIHGRGHVFAIRLRPAALTVLSDLDATAIADAAVPLTEAVDRRLHTLMRQIARQPTTAARARVADEAIRSRLMDRPATATGLLANAVLDELRARLRSRTGTDLAKQFHLSERTIERALTDTLGHGPKWVSRRVRLQEVALALATKTDDDLSAIAAELGYADQSHLARDFRAVAGVTPSRYRRDLARLRTG